VSLPTSPRVLQDAWPSCLLAHCCVSLSTSSQRVSNGCRAGLSGQVSYSRLPHQLTQPFLSGAVVVDAFSVRFGEILH
jgi:hypothetical protein